jgi:hypothetical protein
MGMGSMGMNVGNTMRKGIMGMRLGEMWKGVGNMEKEL